MEYDVHFPYPQPGTLINEFEHTTLGRDVVAGFNANFSSASEVIGASYANGAGGTIVDLPNGNSLNFDNVPRPRFARIVRAVTAYFGGQQ